MSRMTSAYPTRLASLDVFRGAAIMSMIVVNNRGGDAPPLESLAHATWHGWTFADLVFPFFLWTLGMSMTFSLARRIEENPDQNVLLHVLQRALLLFGLGVLLNGFPHYNMEIIRIPGVLQRIAGCYLIGALILIHTSPRSRMYWIIGLSTAYWVMMTMVPIPHYGSGVLSPHGNVAQHIDHLLLAGHLSPGTDPEGILSTLPAITNVLFGTLCGEWLKRKDWSAHEKTIVMCMAGVTLVASGEFLNQFIPINKKLWTPSFVLLSAGWAFLGFACCYWMIEVSKRRNWSWPLMICGVNPIAIYAISILFARTLKVSGGDWVLYERVFLSIAPQMVASLLYSLLCVVAMYCVAWVLYKRQWLLRL